MKQKDLKKLKSFAATSRKTPIDWFKRLSNRRTISKAQITSWSKDSKSWVTCACGVQCAIIPRGESGRPHDDKLAELGGKFHVQIEYGNPQKALSVLKRIEKRSLELINMEVKKIESMGLKICGVKE